MNDKFTNNVNGDEDNLARKLDQAAGQTHANAQFAAELEERLRNAYQPKAGWFMIFNQVSPVLRWVALMGLLALVLSLSIKSLIPAPQPAAGNTPFTSDVPTETPLPPFEYIVREGDTCGGIAASFGVSVQSLVTLNNLPADCIISVGQTIKIPYPIPTPVPDILPDENATPAPPSGGHDWRGTKLYLAASLPGAPAEANIFLLTEEQPASIERAQALASQFGIQGEIFESHGRSPDTMGYLVTDGRQRLYVLSDVSYDYYSDYGSYSYMSGAKTISDEQAATVIEAFMKSHGLNFEYNLENPHVNPGMYYVLPLTPDGLPVYHNYNMPERLEFTIDDHEQVIRVISYQVRYDVTGGTYGIRTAEEAFQQVLGQPDVIQNGVLEVMRSAGISDTSFWSRSYPDNQTITIYGQPASNPAAAPGSAPLISIGQHTVVGNISGMESIDTSTYLEVTGQFVTENGIRRLRVDSWKITGAAETYLSGSLRREGDQILLTADDGSGEYVIEDAPADLPLETIVPDEYLAVSGFLTAGKLNWSTIEYYPPGSGGGGGGNGTGFYQLNLSGTPVPFPSPTAQPETNQGTGDYTVKEGDMLSLIASNFGITVDELTRANGLTDPVIYVGQKLIIPGAQSGHSIVGQRVEGVRGIFTMTIYRNTDGSQHVEYGLNPKPNESPFFFALLEGANLQDLQAHHNRPVDIWGTVERIDQNGSPVVNVERYEIPFPDLQFQLLQGRQRITEMDGQQVALFTTADGTTYAQVMTIGMPDTTILGLEGSDVILETLAIPGETFGGYPALRVFSGSMAVNPKNNQATEMTITADQPNMMEEALNAESYTPPPLTIEKVELVYYVPDPQYGSANLNTGPQYLQPAWRFYGHYSNGSEVEFLVQALKQEFLLPELAPYLPPG